MIELGQIPAKKEFLFKNWAGIYSCKPQLYFQPRSVDEVITIVNNARSEKKTIVTVGSGHSPSNMCMTSEWLMNLDNLNQVIKYEENKEQHYMDVTVDAGLRVYQLNDWLAEKGYAIQNLGSISEQSVAGIISTGTHGSSPYHGLVSSNFVNLTIVNGKGELVFLDSENHPDVFRAALLSLGKIGIIVKATIRTIPAFNIKSSQEVITFDTLLEIWDTIWSSSEFIRVWWYPYTRKCILWRGVKTEEEVTPPRYSWWGSRLGRFLYEALLYVSVRIYPALTPYIEEFVFNRQYGNVETYGNGDIAIASSVKSLNMDCLFSQFVDEWSCPLDNGPEILRSLDHSITQACNAKEFYVHVPVEIRCSNTTLPPKPLDYSDRTSTSPGPVYGNRLRPYLDNTPSHCRYAPLSDVTNGQLTLYINATIYRPFYYNTPIHKWYKLFENTMAAAGGKPHWAKNFLGSTKFAMTEVKEESDYEDFEMRGMAKKIQEWYGEDLKQFQEIRRQQDPENIFVSNKEWAILNGIVTANELEN
ncbi:hypothetical protein TPHA_0I00160 [Tetrapisispora phaffii CBS 4417]|uniref:D-arabinono-1,4-lactone oxidase n=1 Tax=Tetrapisispora phaffii (strain ATCC 24235 / CBS 4417 / NBRC 1672 / NRRL Y-8282 / UCD 70-5) TaxID=1071381 RepID=G8BX95_TETPH|nr:hypothetical protein TPHA_0I00160 [Tetrapisispora phaffii CBS 4417]CCE64523.1 hypothetical protein TPHA_0I00160 [Tetrapisispora phaffii CBS 4417]